MLWITSWGTKRVQHFWGRNTFVTQKFYRKKRPFFSVFHLSSKIAKNVYYFTFFVSDCNLIFRIAKKQTE
jgi:hypothetical protein